MTTKRVVSKDGTVKEVQESKAMARAIILDAAARFLGNTNMARAQAGQPVTSTTHDVIGIARQWAEWAEEE